MTQRGQRALAVAAGLSLTLWACSSPPTDPSPGFGPTPTIPLLPSVVSILGNNQVKTLTPANSNTSIGPISIGSYLRTTLLRIQASRGGRAF